MYKLLLLTLIVTTAHAQSDKSLEDTKSYIVRTIDEHARTEYANRRQKATFEGDLLRIAPLNNDLNKLFSSGEVYNFANVYRFKGPIKEPNDFGLLVIWVDYLLDEKKDVWKKRQVDLFIKNYQVAEQLMLAFQHLNKLLVAAKPPVEKF